MNEGIHYESPKGVYFANFIARGFNKNNARFNQNERDNCLYSFWLLREKFKERGILLNTPDINQEKNNILFEIHLDIQNKAGSLPKYLLLWETSQVNPKNDSPDLLNGYKKIYSWNDDFVANFKYEKYCMPVYNDGVPFSIGFNGRDKLCCAIAGNKSIPVNNASELYSKRVEVFKWFEKHAPRDFDLFGTEWDVPATQPGLYGRVISKLVNPLYRCIRACPFPSYKGVVASKRATLDRYRFSICYENVSDLNGYISEKIFDSFFAGCVPIYWGASNITQYIPESCFVDRRKFSNNKKMYEFIKSISEADYKVYQLEIKTFLSSKAASIFYPESFATHLVNSIMKDFDINR
jgi:hypothetical protein